jgi:hypothetical protein
MSSNSHGAIKAKIQNWRWNCPWRPKFKDEKKLLWSPVFPYAPLFSSRLLLFHLIFGKTRTQYLEFGILYEWIEIPFFFFSLKIWQLKRHDKPFIFIFLHFLFWNFYRKNKSCIRDTHPLDSLLHNLSPWSLISDF